MSLENVVVPRSPDVQAEQGDIVVAPDPQPPISVVPSGVEEEPLPHPAGESEYGACEVGGSISLL